MASREKLKKFQKDQRKAHKENVNEVVDELQFERDMADPRYEGKPSHMIKRAIRQKIPDSTRKWLVANGYGDLWPKYQKWVKSVAKEKNKLASKLANELGLDLEKEHWTPVAGMGDIPPKMPYTSVSDRGPDSEGGTGSGKFNRRVGNKAVFQRKVLQQLGVATNWQESVTNFIADRPDIKNPAQRRKEKLPPLPVRKASNLALLKIQQKDLTGGQLESMMDLEYDLKKSGIISSKNDESLLNNYLDKINTKETARHAEKHSWKRNNKGELILDKNKQPIPSGQWDLNTKEAFRKDGDQEWFAKRKSDAINAVKRGNPKFTKLARGTRKADAAARIGADLATGNYLGAGATAGTLGAMQLLGNKPMQKAIGGQIARLIGRQGAKTAAKAVPGLDIWLSLKDAQHYLRQGKLDQAGIAALSGAIGWIPVIGDGGAAALDFANTGLDISRMQVPTTKKKKVIKAKQGFTPTRRLKFGI